MTEAEIGVIYLNNGGRGHKLKFAVSPWHVYLVQHSVYAHQPSAKVHLCFYWENARGAGHSVCVQGGAHTKHAEHWVCPWASWWDMQVRCPRQLAGGLLDGVRDAVSRILNSLMPSESPICHSHFFFSPLSCVAHDSVAQLSNASKLIFPPSNSVLALLCWKPRLPQRLSCLWVIV